MGCLSSTNAITNRDTKSFEHSTSDSATSSTINKTIDCFDSLHNDIISCICAVNDNQYISACVDGTISVINWNSPNCKLSNSINGHESTVTCMKYKENENFLVSSSRDKSIKLWKLDINNDKTILTQKNIFNGHTKGVTSIDLNEKSSNLSLKLWTGGRDAHTIVWDLQSGKQIFNKYIDRNLTRALKIVYDCGDSSDDNHAIQCCEDLKLRIWDARMGNVHTTVESGTNIPLSIAMDKNGFTCFVTFNGFSDSGCEIKAFDVRNMQKGAIFEQKHHSEAVTCCNMLQTQDLLLTGSRDQTVAFWNVENSNDNFQSFSFTQSIKLEQQINSIASSQKYTYVGCNDGNTVVIRHSSNNFEKRKPKIVAKGCYNPDGCV